MRYQIYEAKSVKYDAQQRVGIMAGLITEKEYEKACGSVMEVKVRTRDLER
jgi:hypothetical protein